MADKTVFPRIPESNWWTLRDQFAKTLPNQVTPVYLKTLLGLGSDSAARNLLPPLRQLNLIDEDGKPTARANAWRSNDKYAEVCQQMMEEVYPQELRDLFSGSNVDRKAVESWFKFTGQSGESTARQAAAMYVLLNEKTPRSAAEFAKSKKTPSQPAKRQRKSNSLNTPKPEPVTTPAKLQPDGTRVQMLPDSSRSKRGSRISLHIDLQIHISPQATMDQIEKIFESMAKYLPSIANQEDDEN